MADISHPNKPDVGAGLDLDSEETREWLEALDSLISYQGNSRAQFVLDQLLTSARQRGIAVPNSAFNRAYIDVAHFEKQVPFPGSLELEQQLINIVCWNAVALQQRVTTQNHSVGEIGEKIIAAAAPVVIASNHFFHGRSDVSSGDLLCSQKNFAPLLLARALMEAPLPEPSFSEENIRTLFESTPSLWRLNKQGPILAIHQAYLMGYLKHRRLINAEGKRVWGIFSDVEASEPGSLGAIALAAKAKLDNLIFIINSDVDSLAGSGGSTDSRLELFFAGAGWNVIGERSLPEPDVQRLFTALQVAVNHKGGPSVIFFKHVNAQGKLFLQPLEDNGLDNFKQLRNRLKLPLSDEQVAQLDLYQPAPTSAMLSYLNQRRDAMGELLPRDHQLATKLIAPELIHFAPQISGSSGREVSTTSIVARILTQLIKEKNIGRYVVPIIGDETVKSVSQLLFKQAHVYSPIGPSRKADNSSGPYCDGQILEADVSITEATCSWIAAATAYANHNTPLLPFYIYSAAFGFVGDLLSTAADIRARGFLVGMTTTSPTRSENNGLRYQEGLSHLIASAIPSCRAYDPCYGYELAVIIQDGLRRLVETQENVFYFVTTTSETYVHPALPEEINKGILKGLYRLSTFYTENESPHVHLLGSGATLNEVIAAADILQRKWDIASDVWSVTSFSELRREGMAVEHWNRLHPERPQRISYVSQCLSAKPDPVIAASGYARAVCDLIRPYMPARYISLGTDDISKTDQEAREMFEVDRYSIIIAALKALADEGKIPVSYASKAIRSYGVDVEA